MLVLLNEPQLIDGQDQGSTFILCSYFVRRHLVNFGMFCCNMISVRSITPHLLVSSRVLGCEENLYLERWNSWRHPPIQPIKSMYVTLLTNQALSNHVDLREYTKTMGLPSDRRGQIADFRDSFERINSLYLLFKCGIKKTKTHFEWLIRH